MFAPAKVNLFLHVGRPWENGRHPLDSLVVFAESEAADRLSVEESDGWSLDVTGPFSGDIGPSADNLVLKAARALQDISGTSTGAHFTLEKNLPTAAGIGGGSVDAGAALRLLCALWGVDRVKVEVVAPKLGGDVLAALHNAPCQMRGDGDLIEMVPDLPPLAALLVNPGVACPTGAVFDHYDQAGGGEEFAEITNLPDFGQGDGASLVLIDWLGDMRNDLEEAAIELVPEIGETQDAMAGLPGAKLTRMSGSGATCFTLFADMAAAKEAATKLSADHPGWWVRATTLGAGA